MRMEQKKFFFEKKISKWPNEKSLFSKIFKKFSQKFHGLVLGLVGLNDAKGIDVAHPVWP